MVGMNLESKPAKQIGQRSGSRSLSVFFGVLPAVISSPMVFTGLQLQPLLPSRATLVRLRGHAAAFPT